MTTSTRWALPLLAAGQAQKEITHNEAVLAIDALLQLGVVSRRQSGPPADAVPGDVHIVAAAATGDWQGGTGRLASFDGRGWTLVPPREGCLAWVGDEGEFSVFAGSGWSSGGWPASGICVGGRTLLAAVPQTVLGAAGGSTVDLECRFALAALLAALRSQGLIM